MKLLQHGRIFQLVAGHPALDLVNTLDWRFRTSGPEELLSSYDDLLRFAAQAELLRTRQIKHVVRGPASDKERSMTLEYARSVREAAAEAFYAVLADGSASSGRLGLLEHAFKEARSHQRLILKDQRLRWDWREEEDAAALPLWAISIRLMGLLVSDDLHLLRECGNPECRWLFIDASKNHTRRWCDMKLCGNRMKARRFKAQHQS